MNYFMHLKGRVTEKETKRPPSAASLSKWLQELGQGRPKAGIWNSLGSPMLVSGVQVVGPSFSVSQAHWQGAG